MADSARVEAFSDGVFAIAITLLVLEIKVPAARTGLGLWHALGDEWPSYAAYVVSFLVIGVMWVNHHTVFSYIARVDRTLMFLNLLVLLVVAALRSRPRWWRRTSGNRRPRTSPPPCTGRS